MKRILSTILLCVTTLCAYSQEDITLFFLNDGTFKGFYDEEIDSITYSHLDLDSVWHADAVVQDVWLADSVVRIPIEKIDSICHKVPEPEFNPGTIILDDRYLPYITSVNGLTISFSSSLPENLRPHKGDVLYYNGISDLFPEGFAGKVVSEGNTVTCEQADIPDIYQKFVFFGKYTVVKKDHAGKPSYALRRIKGRPNPDNGTGGGGSPWGSSSWGDDDDFGIGDGRFPDFTIGSLKEAFEFELKDYHVKIKTSFKLTPVFTIEYAYAFNFFEPLLFFKCKKTVDYETSFSVAYAQDYNQLKDDGFWEKRKGGDIPLSTEAPEMFKKIGIESLSRDKKDRGTVYFIDKKFPIPECPLIQLGAEVGFFITPKLEGELVLGASNKGTYEKTYIYNLDKNHWLHLSDDWKDYLLPWRYFTGKFLKMGDWKCIDGPQTCEPTDWYLDGSVKGSIWTGLVAGANISAGFGENAEVKEEAKFRIGPYMEGELKLKLLDALSDWSRYSLVKDTHLKMGVKLGLNLSFSAKLKSDYLGSDVGFQWDQIDWSPKKLLWERTWYLLPEYEAPKYTIRGNSLICTANVSRMTFPNTLGFALIDETGKVKRKYMDATYKNYRADNPFHMSLTFDGLDFANHRYTIVPSSELFTADWLRFDAPDQYRTTVLCPDSRHPHLIDLGLPSGTKWMCSNLYADDPKDAGGYYQWGKPFKVNSYTDQTYKAPNITMPNYQSSEYDAATANLGQAYCTPTMSQFLELHDNCSLEYKYSPLGNNVLGVFLKGKNGNNLYLPYSGFKSGIKVKNSSEGWFLSSDAMDSNNKLQRKAVVLKNNDAIWGSADALAYGHSVRPVGAGKGGLVFEPQQLDYEVIVGQKVGQTVTVTNNGSTPVGVTVAQTIAPFHVDDACLGTFTVKPKERLDVLVDFSPTEEIEYTSVLTLSYETSNACVVSKIPLRGKGINANKLTLSETSVSLQKGDKATVTITSGSGQYTLTNSNSQIVTAAIANTNQIVIVGQKAGTATITVTDTKTKQTARIIVVVEEESGPTTPTKITITTDMEIGENFEFYIKTELGKRMTFWIDYNNNGINDENDFSEQCVNDVWSGYRAVVPVNTKTFSIYLKNASGLDMLEKKITDIDFREFNDKGYDVKLKELFLDYNKLKKLDVSNLQYLTRLSCDDNELISLDVSNLQYLTRLSCDDNELISLDASGCSALTCLSCSDLQLNSLDVSGCTALEQLYCENNQLTSLDVSGCTALKYLYCENNQLTSLDVSGCSNLEYFDSYNNHLQSLILSNHPKLKELACRDNRQLGSIDLSGLPNLETLNAVYCGLETLNVRNNPKLTALLCDANNLQSLDLSQNQSLACIGINYNDLGVDALNSIYRQVPDLSGQSENNDIWWPLMFKMLRANGNPGYWDSDRSIAEAKGWEFEDKSKYYEEAPAATEKMKSPSDGKRKNPSASGAGRK